MNVSDKSNPSNNISCKRTYLKEGSTALIRTKSKSLQYSFISKICCSGIT